MKFISHRGNLNGPRPDEENKVAYIREALSHGYDVEIDVRLLGDTLYLGHDRAQETINLAFLENDRLWVHAKTPETFLYLLDRPVHSFFQSDDLLALTTRGYLWHHFTCSHFRCHKSVLMVMGEPGPLADYQGAHGVCSDFVSRF